ncbi:DUF6364 family protein [Algoriphagus persicinus]|uniref:DUF6364 family protein n=1 Tax=Algoriphagus persicinus TaxID=3108754 RepID=UPI002B3B447B|nr:DUF6364 family protein [Algoriphagus sp. E1-3-M2]MEB2783604.1 DUF6364 family protein [Algoriphagus sp. E1-3-M2]
MTTKLTIDINEALAEKAKKYAEAQGQSLSDLVETLFSEIILDEKNTKMSKKKTLKPLPESFLKLRGSLKFEGDFDYKEELTKALTEKYGH